MKLLALSLFTALLSFSMAAQAQLDCTGTYKRKKVYGGFHQIDGYNLFVLQNLKTDKVEGIFWVRRTSRGLYRNYEGLELNRDAQVIEGRTFSLTVGTLPGNRSHLVRYENDEELDRTELVCRNLVDTTIRAKPSLSGSN